MIAVDTNILARFFVDDPGDAEAVRTRPLAIEAMGQSCFVAVTVLLEFEWVLRGYYKIPRTEILQILRMLCGLENVSLDDRAHVLLAVDAFAAGLDFADALHLARCSRAISFQTFDRKLAKKAQQAGLSTPVEYLA